MAAATALIRNTKLNSRQVAEEAMNIAAKICIFTNSNITYEEIG
jgi:ATP-dependent HslUV protease subunit HslV